MEKRVLEKLMFGSFLAFAVLLIAGWYLKLPILLGAGIALGVISIICWMELDWIDSRHRRLEKKYGQSK